MTNELQTVGAMHQCRAGEPYSTCVHCGALAEALNKPCPHFMRDASQKLAGVASPTPQADSQPAPEYVGNGMFKGETIEKAAEHWANWCDVRSIGGVAEFLRFVAKQADSQPAPVQKDAALSQAAIDNPYPSMTARHEAFEQGVLKTLAAFRAKHAARKQGGAT